MRTAEDLVREKNRDILFVDADATVGDALKLMTENKVGAVFVKENDDIVGIWTERDLVYDSLSDDFSPRTTRIGDVMTRGLKTARHTDTVLQLIDKFLGMRLRHLPIEKDGRYIGVLSAGDAMKATLHEKAREFQELNALVSWEYYEEWKW
jgi:CBS domain-containing protein